MPKFSIIIPEYNSSEKIRPAIKTLQRQSLKDFEVIIVDDCSPDNSAEKIEHLLSTADLNSTIIKSEKNVGPGIARNIGVNQAKGHYICFLDADDYISDDYFEILDKIINSTNSDLIYFGNYHVIGNNIRVITPFHFNDRESFIALASGALWKFCFKRDLFDNYSLPALRNAEDIAVIPLIIAKAEIIAYCDKPLYYYIHNNESLSSTHSPNVTYNFVKSFDYTLSHLEKPYSSGIEFHGIKTVVYGGVLNGLKAKIKWGDLKEILNDFERNFPLWLDNKYIKLYPVRKRLFLYLVKLRCYLLLKLYVIGHNLLLKYL